MKYIYILLFSLLCLGTRTTNAQFKVLFNFDGTAGKYPAGSLTLSGHTLFGMTQWGGAYGNGNIFSIDTSGQNFKNLLQFNNQGTYPYGDLTLSGHKLYGLTYWGGKGFGNAFSIDTDGSGIKNLFSFNDTDGEDPTASFILSNGTLYGTTEQGGISKVGVIFSMDTDGSNFTDLFELNGTNGAYPQGSLMLFGHKLYGMANRGGANDSGMIFSLNINGSGYTDLFDFNGVNGQGAATASPSGTFIHSGNRLYGMTNAGGTYNYGCIFSIDTNGTGYKKLLDFNPTNGGGPFGSLILVGENLYGVTSYGGIYDDGVIFSIDTGGNTYTILHEFNDTNGYFASGSLILAGHKLYGMAYAGGKYGGGIIFSYNLCPSLTITTTSNSDNGTCNGVATVNVVNGGNPPYTYLWTKGGQTTATITGQCAGTYCCTITCKDSCSQLECVTIKSTAGINNVGSNSNKIKVYPNPSNGVFTFQAKSEELRVNSFIEVYNEIGQQVYFNYQINTLSNYQINLSTQPNGVYLYRVIDNNSNLIGEGKLVIEK